MLVAPAAAALLPAVGLAPLPAAVVAELLVPAPPLPVLEVVVLGAAPELAGDVAGFVVAFPVPAWL
jgi:hypothetical protein